MTAGRDAATPGPLARDVSAPGPAQPRLAGLRTLLPLSSLLGFALAVAAVVAIGLVSHLAQRARLQAVQAMAGTQDTLAELNALASRLKDAETGQRGYLLTGSTSYLAPYHAARATLPAQFSRLHVLTADNPRQHQRLQALEKIAGEKLDELEQTLALHRGGQTAAALSQVQTDRGQRLMDAVRGQLEDMEREERERVQSRRLGWDSAVVVSQWVTWGGSALLLVLISAAAAAASRAYRSQAVDAWLRAGQSGLAERLQGDPRLERLGEQALSFLADYLEAQVGAIYLAEPDGHLRRVAGWALASDAGPQRVAPGERLVGQALQDRRVLVLEALPAGYLDVSSAVGRTGAHSLLVAPAVTQGDVQGVVELGFLRRLGPVERQLLERVSEPLAIALRTARDRSRLEELLEETRRQAEELQAQEEELRAGNEELEAQGRALLESQAQLEEQHRDLSHTNARLEEHAALLTSQRADLARAQLQLGEKAAALERANQYKLEFLANMSHELRTPLNSALILAKLLADNRDGNLKPEQVRYAQTISSAGHDLLTLINDILDISKIEAGKVEVQPERILLSRLVQATTDIFAPVARQRGLGLELSLATDLPEQIETDPARLSQILKNLVSNALKFTEAGGVTFKVRRSAQGDRIEFAVEDTGIGIAAAQQELIFEAFRQADGSTHRKYGGTGLGLSISRELARLLGGDIAVQSEPGRGSTFTLSLPVAWRGREAAPAPASPALATAPVRAPWHDRPAAPAAPAPEDDRDLCEPGGRTLLVIDDDERFARILRDLGRELGYRCVLAHTAEDGLAAALRYQPSAILLDLKLPDHSGLGVLDRLKHDGATRHIPVHVISVTDLSQEALEMGAAGYALKPVPREELAVALRRLETRFAPGPRRLLVVEDDERQRDAIGELLAHDELEITGVASAEQALVALRGGTFDCLVLDLALPGMSGYELLERMAGEEELPFPPVIVYTGRALTEQEEHALRRYSRSVIIKGARSPERLLDEVTLFLHQVESRLPADRQRMLQAARARDELLDGRRVLVVEDDVRNVFALSAILERQGVEVEIARNGREAVERLCRPPPGTARVDLVLMDIMMPEMDGYTAMREIRRQHGAKKLPIIALTAKAMRDDQERCLAAGANDYIAKPLDVEKLMSLVRVWMPR
ncbi:MAG: response regulator [Pseudomonadota bacterium]